MANAFQQPQYGGNNAFVPSAQTAQMLAGGASSSPWASMNQMLVGQRQQAAEEQAFLENKQKEATALSLEQSRYNDKVQTAREAVEYQKQLDNAQLVTGTERWDGDKKQVWVESKAGAGTWKDAGSLSPTERASVAKAKNGGKDGAGKPSVVGDTQRKMSTNIVKLNPVFKNFFEEDMDGKMQPTEAGRALVDAHSQRARALMDEFNLTQEQANAIATKDIANSSNFNAGQEEVGFFNSMYNNIPEQEKIEASYTPAGQPKAQDENTWKIVGVK